MFSLPPGPGRLGRFAHGRSFAGELPARAATGGDRPAAAPPLAGGLPDRPGGPPAGHADAGATHRRRRGPGGAENDRGLPHGRPAGRDRLLTTGWFAPARQAVVRRVRLRRMPSTALRIASGGHGGGAHPLAGPAGREVDAGGAGRLSASAAGDAAPRPHARLCAVATGGRRPGRRPVEPKGSRPAAGVRGLARAGCVAFGRRARAGRPRRTGADAAPGRGRPPPGRRLGRRTRGNRPRSDRFHGGTRRRGDRPGRRGRIRGGGGVPSDRHRRQLHLERVDQDGRKRRDPRPRPSRRRLGSWWKDPLRSRGQALLRRGLGGGARLADPGGRRPLAPRGRGGPRRRPGKTRLGRALRRRPGRCRPP